MNTNSKNNLEKRILVHEEQIERREKEIAVEEQKILAIDQHIMKNIETVKKEGAIAAVLYRHRFFISLIVTGAVALVWYGIGQLIGGVPILSNGIGALLIGSVLLYLINRYASPPS